MRNNDWMTYRIRRLSQLEAERRMGHDVRSFHNAQLAEPEFMRMIRSTANEAAVLAHRLGGRNATILELGAGSGILSVETVKRLLALRERFDYLITEPDADLIRFCRNRLARKNYELATGQRLRFCQIRAEDLRLLGKRSYDLVISSEVFHHLPYNRKLNISKEILRHMKANGMMVIGDQFIADAYEYKKNGKLVDDRREIAPRVAEYVEMFYNRLWGGKLPDSFRRALDQQREGIVECKTSLPHLLSVLGAAGWRLDSIEAFDKRINSNGGYAVLVLGHGNGNYRRSSLTETNITVMRRELG